MSTVPTAPSSSWSCTATSSARTAPRPIRSCAGSATGWRGGCCSPSAISRSGTSIRTPERAAEAGRGGRAPRAAFWQMHDRMYEAAGRALARDLIGYAAELGLDVGADRGRARFGRTRAPGPARRRQRRRQRGHRHAGVLHRRAPARRRPSTPVPDRALEASARLSLSSGARPGRSPGPPPPRTAPAARRRAGRGELRRPSVGSPCRRSSRCSPLTETVLRRSRRTGVESRRCTPAEPEAARRHQQRPRHVVAASRTRACSPTTRSAPGTRPRRRRARSRCGTGRRRARGCRRRTRKPPATTNGARVAETMKQPAIADPDRAGQRDDGQRDQRPIGELGLQRAPLSSSSAWAPIPDREEEGRERGRAAGRCGSAAPPLPRTPTLARCQAV